MKNNNKTSSPLFNPFIKIAGSKALMAGLVVVIITIVIGHCGGIFFNGVFDVHPTSANIQTSFAVQAISLAILILMAFAAGKIFAKHPFRFIDVAGTIMLSRTPFVILSLAAMLLPSLQSSTNNVARTLLGVAFVPANTQEWTVFVSFTLLTVVVWVWFATLVYNAIAESCNLRGVKGVIATISGLLIAEITGMIILFLIFGASISIGKPDNTNEVSATQTENTGVYNDVNEIALNLAEDIK